ncbi:DUF4811 domain-containing protein [Lacticaseibacillus parakribbianus]|uniref:DUF4811 domain-containing protein n=1 Tax=Lacticaseibacillus parakribbianus TaxID=2970927 RepID=UPI0021CB008E|nr:DUF4811 domain-containing protein [Lacticaseibacillus parakribbianus]
MILVIMALSAIAYFFVAVLAPAGRGRRIGMWSLAALLILSAAGIAANDSVRFGLTTVTVTKREPLVGTKTAKVLVTKNRAKAPVVLYRTNPLQHKVLTAASGTTTTVAIKTGTKATVTTTDRQLRYRNGWAAFLFAWSGQNGYRLHRTVTFTVPDDWQIN